MRFSNLTFVSDDGMLAVMVLGDCIREMRSLALRARDRETGSVLMGSCSADGRRVLVDRCGPVPFGSKGSLRSYIRASVGLEAYYKEVFRMTNGMVYYIGEWHSHPYSGVEPSILDNQTMRDISLDMDGAGVVSIIVGGDFIRTFEVGLNVYLRRQRIPMRVSEN